jgi:hypothetical protein
VYNMVNEAQTSAFLLGGTAIVGAYAQNTGIGSSIIGKIGLTGQIADIVIGGLIAGLGLYFDGQWGDYAIAFGTGYLLSAVL